jgi:hypothetical protein
MLNVGGKRVKQTLGRFFGFGVAGFCGGEKVKTGNEIIFRQRTSVCLRDVGHHNLRVALCSESSAFKQRFAKENTFRINLQNKNKLNKIKHKQKDNTSHHNT